RGHLQALISQDLAEGVPEGGLVIDDEHPLRRGTWHAAHLGPQ
ncbi:MAG: hypothetical protein ACI8PZ_006527, partial [Myxococcota bacterium]